MNILYLINAQRAGIFTINAVVAVIVNIWLCGDNKTMCETGGFLGNRRGNFVDASDV